MNIDKTLVFFGFVRRVIWRDFEGRENVQTWQSVMSTPRKTIKRAAGLFCTGDKKTLYFIPWVKPEITPVTRGRENLKKIYEIWSNREALEQIKIWIPASIKKLDHYGFIQTIEYTSDKLERASDRGQYHLYTHDFKKERPLFINCALTPYMWGVQSSAKIMSWRGIIG